MKFAFAWRAGLVASVIALLQVAGCSTASVTPTKVEEPTQTYSVVALGQLMAADDATATSLLYFRNGFTRRLEELKGFEKVFALAPEALPPDAVVVSGQFLAFSEGSRALRFWIGFGAGSAQLRASFEIRDASGKVLAQFEGSKSYAGDLGIGGFDAADMNDLMSKFGAQTAEAVSRWSKGQSLQE